MNRAEVIERSAKHLKLLRKDKPWICVSMGISQIGQESGWGRHAPGNNFLGIKAPANIPEHRKQLLWTTEYIDGKWIRVQAWFVIYDSFEDCIDRYIKILELPRYTQTRDSKDFYGATSYVRLNGYATSPHYTTSLRRNIMGFKLYVHDWLKDPDTDITPNFKWGESFSGVSIEGRRHRRIIEPYKEYWSNVRGVAKEFQILRNHYKVPFVVNSWFRTPEYNAIVNGASRSQHLTGKAMDVAHWRGITNNQLERMALDYTKIRGIGFGRNFFHGDTRTRYARWYY